MADSTESEDVVRPRRPLLFGANPRINLARLGVGGWVVLLGLCIAAAVFYRYTLGAMYYGVAAGAYGVGWFLDRLLSATRFPDAPWIGWALSGAALGAVIGFFAIAPVYGLRRWRWIFVALVLAAMAAAALLPVRLPVSEGSQLPDRFGPVVRVDGRITTHRGDSLVFKFLVLDQSRHASVWITIDRRGGRTYDRIRIHRVQTGVWTTKVYLCRLRPGTYRYVVTAEDGRGQPAVHDGRARLIVRAR